MIPKEVRNDFPMLGAQPDLVYLDTAATSQTPRSVIDAMDAYHTRFRANVHRGFYASGVDASLAYEQARDNVARFIGAERNEVIFTAGATASSNMLIAMCEHSGMFSGGGELVTTAMEHHASLIPLQCVAKKYSISLKHIPLKDQSVSLDYDVLTKFITSKTKMVSVMLASNVTGEINNVARIAKIAHEAGALVVCDAAAAVGHIPVDVRTLGADFLYFSGHKMCGSTGIGILWGKEAIMKNLEPGIYGGGIVREVTFADALWREPPHKFEAGTPNIAGAVSLSAAVEYLERIGIREVHAHATALAAQAQAVLKDIPDVRVFAGLSPARNAGIVSFTLKGVHPHDIADMLGREHIAVRAGHHCAMPLVTDALGVSALVRASFYLYNTAADIDTLVQGIQNVKQVFGKK